MTKEETNVQTDKVEFKQKLNKKLSGIIDKVDQTGEYFSRCDTKTVSTVKKCAASLKFNYGKGQQLFDLLRSTTPAGIF